MSKNEENVNELKNTTEVIKNEIIRKKAAQDEISGNISDEIEK